MREDRENNKDLKMKAHGNKMNIEHSILKCMLEELNGS
jgi:hypothetical protein